MENKQTVQKRIEEIMPDLRELSDYLWHHPEYSFHEFKASKAMSELLRKYGFQVETGVGGIETSVKAVYDSGKPGLNVGFVGEFDAFPGMGHACGHNLMCAIACGAGIGLKSVIDTLGGKITVLGTPAEEGGGGKITMLENGAFEGLDFAMLTHASSDTCVNDISYSRTDIRVHYYGKTAHAATWPEEGISALTPVLELFNIVNAMRLEIGDKGKILGIIRDGGDQAIFIPDHCSAEFTIRSFSMKYKWELFHRFIKICENVAAITGTRFEYEMIDLSYEDIRNNPVLEDTLAENFKVLGEELCPRLKEQGIGCTDMGNVTHALPGIQAYIRLRPGLRVHTPEFEEATGSPDGYRAIEAAAKGMAMTAVDILSDSSKMEAVRKAFSEMKAQYE